MRLATLLLGLFCIGTMHAQTTIERQVISTGGGEGNSGTMTLEATVGEAATTDLTSGTKTLTQGFHQVTGLPSVSAVGENELDIDLTVYPNPSSDFFNLDFGTTISTDLRLEMIDGRGAVIESKTIGSETGSVAMTVDHYPAGSYILRLIEVASGRSSTWSLVKMD